MGNYFQLKYVMFSILTLTMLSCGVKRWISPISQSDEFVWNAKTSNQEFRFEITDKFEDPNYKFYGLIIIDEKDSLFLRGFQKGSHHIISYVHIEHNNVLKKYDSEDPNSTSTDTINVEKYGLSLWLKGSKSDTLVADVQLNEPSLIPNGTRFIKTKK